MCHIQPLFCHVSLYGHFQSFPTKKDGTIWATVLTARPPCGRRGQAVTNSRNCLSSQLSWSSSLLQVQLAMVQRCPKPSSLTIFFQVSCGQAPAKLQNPSICTHTTCKGSHKRIQKSDQFWRPQLIGGDSPWRQTKAESCLP